MSFDRCWWFGLVLLAACGTEEVTTTSLGQSLALQGISSFRAQHTLPSGAFYDLEVDLAEGEISGRRSLGWGQPGLGECTIQYELEPSALGDADRAAIEAALAEAQIVTLHGDACEAMRDHDARAADDFPALRFRGRSLSTYPFSCKALDDDGLFAAVLAAFLAQSPEARYLRRFDVSLVPTSEAECTAP